MLKVRLRSREEIQAEIRQEREKIQALQVSIVEWKTTIEGLQKEGGDTESTTAEAKSGDDAWNTRYENQLRYNEKLQKDISEIKTKIKQERAKLKTLLEGGELEEFKGANAQRTLIRLKREKQDLESQLRDYQWRLDQEAQTFFKLDEKRKEILRDIAKGEPRKNKPDQQSKGRQKKVHGGSYAKLQKEKRKSLSVGGDSRTAGVKAQPGRKPPARLPPLALPTVSEKY